MSRGKQYVKKGVWYIAGGRQKEGAIQFVLLASIAAPVLGEVAKPILGKIFGRGRKQRRRIKKRLDERKNSAKTEDPS